MPSRRRKERREGSGTTGTTGAAARSSREPARGTPDPEAPVRVSLVSLGCAKNLIDSEMILGAVGEAGLAITPSHEDADVIVINTCGFIGPAREESMSAIRGACQVKENSAHPQKVVVVGCLAQKTGDAILREVPGVDAIVGLGRYGGIGRFLVDLVRGDEAPRDGGAPAGGSRPVLVSDPNTACNAEVGRFRLTPTHYSYLRISEGCDNPCTFCAIPSIRGRFRSKPPDEVEAEARELVASGARELVLISQDTTSYGVDLDGRPTLPALLERLSAIDGVRWIRVLYAYPTTFSEATIDAIARIPQVVKYVDMPIQHIDDRMLRRMGRRMDEAGTRKLLDRLRDRIPGLVLRTTVLVGFPGESEEEFRRLLDFLREFRFDRLGAFAYSKEEGTPAARMSGEIPAEVAGERLDRLMRVQQEVAFAGNRRRVGETCEVLVDGREGGRMFARSAGEAPEIDPRIFLGRSRKVDPSIGDFLEVRITGTRDYDLVATPIGG